MDRARSRPAAYSGGGNRGPRGRTPLEYRVLGPTEVVDDDGQTVPLGGPQRRALLAALLVRAGEACSADWLAEALWGGEVEDPAGRLHPLVSRLRSALEPSGSGRARASVLASVQGGYRLVVEPGEHDAACFDELVSRAEAAAQDDARGAVETLETAMALWRGPALADVADRPFAIAEAARLEERRLAAQELRLELLVALGRHGEAIPELQTLVDQHPLRERIWSLLMLALYRAGRQGDALRAYSEVRQHLVEELGIEPGRELRELELAILRQDESLDAGVPLASPATRVQAASQAPGVMRTLPPVLAVSDRMPFVGRESERATLEGAWARVGDERQLVLVTGEPGVGKTRLAAELARQVDASGGMVLGGRCDEGMAVPYQPFVEALRHHLGQLPDTALPGALGRLAPELARLVPELAERVEDIGAPLRSDAETERYRLFDAVAGWLAAASALQPVLLVLDDLHWAAPPTLLLLRHVLRSPEPLRVLAVATYRESELDRAHPLVEALGDLRRVVAVERVPLEGLDQGAVRRLLEATGVKATPADLESLAQSVVAETAGNPLFVRELVRHLAETVASRTDGDGRMGFGVPEGVREVVGARLARVSPEATLVLERAAVVGADVDLRLLVTLTGLRDDALDEALEEVTSAGLLMALPGRSLTYRFAHALVRSTVYETITPSRRARLHASVAEALEAGGDGSGDLEAIAEHWARAAPAGYADEAADWAARAGLRAISMLAYETAVTLYGKALEIVESAGADDARRLALLLGLGEAQAAAGNIVDAKTSFGAAADLAEARGEAERLAEAALGYGQAGVTASVVDHNLVALLERAAAALPPDESPLRVKVQARLAAELYFSREVERREKLSEETIVMARRCGDPDALAFALSSHHYVLWGPDGLEERIAVADHLRAVTARTRDTELILQALRWSIIDLLEIGDIPAADEHIARYSAVAAELGRPIYRWWAAVFRAMRLIFAGDLDQGMTVAEEAWRHGRRTTDAALQFYGLQTGMIMRERGQLGGVEPMAKALVEQFPAVPAWRCALATIYADVGRIDDAARELDLLAAKDFADLPRDLGWLPAMANLADVCASVGDVERARVVYDLLVPYAGRNVVVGAAVLCYGSTSRPLGRLAALLGRLDLAEALFERALAENRRMGARPLVAHSEADYADALAQDGSGDRATRAAALRASALSTAHELGLTALAERISVTSVTASSRKKR